MKTATALLAAGVLAVAGAVAPETEARHPDYQTHPDPRAQHRHPVRERPDLRQNKHREFQPGPEREVIGHRSEHSFPALRPEHDLRHERRARPDDHRHQHHKRHQRHEHRHGQPRQADPHSRQREMMRQDHFNRRHHGPVRDPYR